MRILSLLFPWIGEGSGAKGFDIGRGNAASGANNAFMRATSDWNAIVQWVAVQPNTTYTISVNARTHNAQNNAYFGARSGVDGHILNERRFGANPSSTVHCSVCTGNDVYARQTVSFTTGPSESQVKLYVGYWAPGSDSWVQIDDLQMSQN